MELGKNILHNRGELCFITTNKFFNTGYGSKVRAMLSLLRLERIINFEQVEVFKDILVSSVIIGFQNTNTPEGNMIEFEQFVELNHEEFKKEFSNRMGNFGVYLQKYLGETEWSFSDVERLALKEKIQTAGTPICKVEGISVYRGVTTGYNPAFIISDEQRDRLINEDFKNSNVIKNMLQGRNIRKWYYNESNENLIFTRRGFNINDFPTLKTHLFQYYKYLKPKTISTEEFGRKPGKYEWFEILDNTAYYPQFEVSEKIIWGLTANKWAFAYDDKQHYLPSNGYILTSTALPIKYILGILNSKVLHFYFSFIGVMTAGGAYTLKAATIEALPIPKVSQGKQKAIISLVDKILDAKSLDANIDVTSEEQEIDNLVYELYGLTPDEIEIIERQGD